MKGEAVRFSRRLVPILYWSRNVSGFALLVSEL